MSDKQNDKWITDDAPLGLAEKKKEVDDQILTAEKLAEEDDIIRDVGSDEVKYHESKSLDEVVDEIDFAPESYEEKWDEIGTGGFGIYTWSNGDKYVGTRLNGKRHGEGRMTFASGSECSGNWQNGKLNGYCIYNWSNGDKYEGEFKDGERNGKGKYNFSNGNKYEGELKDGKRNGKGTYSWSDGCMYEGEFKNEKRDGQGTYHFLNDGGQGTHKGEWKDGKRDGKGTYTSTYGDKYVGEWEKGKMNGEGIFDYETGESFNGKWDDGQKSGQGVFTFIDGSMYEGQWKEGVPQLEGVFSSPYGEKFQGQWNSGSELVRRIFTLNNGGEYESEQNLNFISGFFHGQLVTPVGDMNVFEIYENANEGYVFTRNITNNNFEAIIFDLDDTLVLSVLLEKFRVTEINNFDGNDYEDELKIALDNEAETLISENLLVELKKTYAKSKFYVLSNSPKKYAEITLKKFYPSINWDGILGFEDLPRPKPYPEGILIIQKLAKVEQIDKVVFVGDRTSDIVSAYQAGCFSILFGAKRESGLYHEIEKKDHYDSLEMIPDAKAENEDDILEILKNPWEWVPPLENIRINKERLFDSTKRYIDTFYVFNPLEDDGGYNDKFITVDVLGRYFSTKKRKYNFSTKKNLSSSTKEILTAKDTNQFPNSWIKIVAKYLRELISNDSSFENKKILVTVIPSRPGRPNRMEIMLNNVKDLFTKNEESSSVSFIPNLFYFKDGVRTNKELNKVERYKNIRDNLVKNDNADVENKFVIVIDDVVTTGASLFFANHILFRNSASKIQCISLTKTIS